MMYRILKTACLRRTAAVLEKQTRTSSYFSFKPETPVIPACFWSTLPNGFRVISEQTSGPLACVTLFAEAGSRFEIGCNNGASHFFEHMAYRGLYSLRRDPFQETIREMGAYLTAHTDREYQTFVCTCPHEAVGSIVKLFSKMFTELESDLIDMGYAKADITRQMNDEENDPKKLCFDYLHQTAFQGTTLCRSPIGPSYNYQRFDKNFLDAFIAQHYQPFRLILSVSSIHSHEDVVCMAQAEFGPMKETTNDVVYWPCRYTASLVKFRDDNMPYCHAAIAVEVGGYTSKDFMALQVMKHVIGRWDASQVQGYNTWPMLAHACQIGKLCHRYEAFYLPYRDVGLWGVYFVIRKEDDFEDAFLMIQDQWMNLCVTTSYPDVERATSLVELELAKAVNGCVSSCFDMGIQMMYTGARKNLLELYDELENVDQLEVRKLANRVIYDRFPTVAAIGPTEGIPDYNRIRSGMYWLRI